MNHTIAGGSVAVKMARRFNVIIVIFRYINRAIAGAGDSPWEEKN
jgi:hypothetical protein